MATYRIPTGNSRVMSRPTLDLAVSCARAQAAQWRTVIPVDVRADTGDWRRVCLVEPSGRVTMAQDEHADQPSDDDILETYRDLEQFGSYDDFTNELQAALHALFPGG